MAAVKGSFAAEFSFLSSPNSYVHWTILQYTRQQFDVKACWAWPLWHEQKFTWQLGSDQSTGSQVHRFGISAVQVLVIDRFTGSAYQQWVLVFVFDRSTGSAIFYLSGWQDGARKGGRSLLPVEAEKLGSGSFLQVVAYKLGGRSLLPVEAGKIEVNIIRDLFLTSSYF